MVLPFGHGLAPRGSRGASPEFPCLRVQAVPQTRGGRRRRGGCPPPGQPTPSPLSPPALAPAEGRRQGYSVVIPYSVVPSPGGMGRRASCHACRSARRQGAAPLLGPRTLGAGPSQARPPVQDRPAAAAAGQPCVPGPPVSGSPVQEEAHSQGSPHPGAGLVPLARFVVIFHRVACCSLSWCGRSACPGEGSFFMGPGRLPPGGFTAQGWAYTPQPSLALPPGGCGCRPGAWRPTPGARALSAEL